MTDRWTNFRLCFNATPGGGIRRLAGWVMCHNGSWWVKRHVCKARAGLPPLQLSNEEAEADAAPWVQAKTRAGCVRYLARAVLLVLKDDPTDGTEMLEWPPHVKERAELALKRGGRIFGREASSRVGIEAQR